MARMASALLSAQVSTWLVTILGLLIVPRYLGTRDFGLLATGATIAGFAMVIASLGTANYLVKEVARRPHDSAEIMANALGLRLVAWLALAAITIPAIFLLINDPVPRTAILLLFIGSAFDLLKTGATAGLQARYALGRTAIAMGLTSLAAQFILIGLLVLGFGLTAVTLTLAGASLVSAGIAIGVFWRRFGLSTSLRVGGMRAVLAGSSAYIGWDVALIIIERVDILMLSVISGATATGYYAFALRLAAVPAFVHTILSGTIYPALSSSVHDREAFARVLQGAIRMLLITTLPMAVGLALLASDATRIIAGQEFAPAAPVAVIMALVIPLIGLDTVLGTALFAADKQRTWTYVAWGGAVLNPSLNLVAIPVAARLWGNPAVGAALATVVTEVVVGALAWRFLRDYVSPRPAILIGVRAAMACAVMAPGVIVAREASGVIAAVATGAVIYTVAAYLLRVVTVADLAYLRQTLRRGPLEPEDGTTESRPGPESRERITAAEASSR